VDLGQQTPGRVQLAVDKGRIEDQLGPLIGDLRLPPACILASPTNWRSLDCFRLPTIRPEAVQRAAERWLESEGRHFYG
jgi:hypothetical protein